MKPFDIAFNFLKSELIESLLDRMEGAELDLSKIPEREEMRDWERFMHSNKRDIPEEERKFPSLRHVRENNLRMQNDEDAKKLQDEMNALDMKELEALLDEGYINYGQRLTRPTNIANEIARFKMSDAGQELRDSLEDQLRDKRISQITGVGSPPNQEYDMRPTTEDQMLIHALKTGDSSALDRYQARTRNPLVGDMPLQEFEQHYPTEMEIEPQLPSSVIPKQFENLESLFR
jgi:hypothetical protein